jgi:hypothetical protein
MIAQSTPEFTTYVMKHPRVHAAMAEDGEPREYHWKQWTVAFQFMNRGVILFRQVTHGGMFDVHIAMIKGHPALVDWVMECLDAMRSAGAKKFKAEVAAWNKPCLRLAKKCGFVEEGRLTQALLRGGQRHDAVIMGAR